MLKKILIIVLLFITQNIFAQFAGGSGSSGDPYLVSTLAQLNSIRSYSSSYYFKQTIDIDASSGITPIDFSAHYDGDGHTISGFTYNSAYADHIALFSYLRSGAEIKNLGLLNVNVYTYYNTGGLVSYCFSGATINNCYVTGNVHGNNSRVGGLVGENYGNIINCYSTATVWTNDIGNSGLGGLVGENTGSISNCFNSGNVTGGYGYYNVGGLVGKNWSGGSIVNSYSTGSVSGYSAVGGFVGDNGGSISNCYSKGHVSSSNTGPAGFCYGNSGSTSNSFWDTQTSGVASSAGGTGKTSAQMTTQSTYTTAPSNWDFTITPIWAISSSYNNGYPILVGVTPTPPPPVVIVTQAASNIRSYTATLNGTVNAKTISTVVHFLYGTNPGTYTDSVTAIESPLSGNTDEPVSGNITGLTRGGTYYFTISTTSTAGYYKGSERSFTTTTLFSGGSGTSGDPYLIGDVFDLRDIRNLSTSSSYYFLQISDIDASATSGWNSGAGFYPLTQSKAYYDGQNHSITSLRINSSGSNQQALFVILDNGYYIKNLKLNISVDGNQYIAGLVYNNSGAISNCGVSGTISAHTHGDAYAAGLVSTNSGTGTIDRCYSTATITDTYSDGFSLGGLVANNQGSINNCYSTGNVGSCNNNGGLVSENSGSITNCYSYGAVTGGSSNRGFAYLSSGTINNCFWNKTINANAYYDNGKGTGSTTAEMTSNAIYLAVGWDNSIWKIDPGINNGYPYLAWQDPGGTPLPVELISFSAKEQDNKVVLSWQTATEVNNYGFDVERSLVTGQQSLAEWEKVGFVPGAGNSNSPKEYSYIDANLIQGNAEYRLKQIDLDGKFKYYSQTAKINFLTAVKEKQIPKEFGLSQNYPNPFNPVTVISYQLPVNGNVTLKIYDILGNEVATLVNEYKQPGYYNVNFNAGNLSSGVYIYRLTAGKFISTKKLMLMK